MLSILKLVDEKAKVLSIKEVVSIVLTISFEYVPSWKKSKLICLKGSVIVYNIRNRSFEDYINDA